jgi:hypothetical protein
LDVGLEVVEVATGDNESVYAESVYGGLSDSETGDGSNLDTEVVDSIICLLYYVIYHM